MVSPSYADEYTRPPDGNLLGSLSLSFSAGSLSSHGRYGIRHDELGRRFAIFRFPSRGRGEWLRV